jgi:hypothetical protein
VGGTAGSGGIGGTGGSAGSAGAGGTNPIDCLTCIGQSCPQSLDCLLDQGCRDGLLCAVTQCASGGQPDLFCMIDCFDGDFGALMLALDTMTCIFGQCADSCGGGLPF